MARVIMSKMMDTFRTLRPNQGSWWTNAHPFRESLISKHTLNVKSIPSHGNPSSFSTFASSVTTGFGQSSRFLQVKENLQTTIVRNNVRCHFPRPSEHKRIKRHGWKTRMSTLPGRRIIMRRILQGRHVLTH